MTIETPFLRFWRTLNEELAKVGSEPASIGDARTLFIVMALVA